jgi:hypothetical protein
MIKFGLFLPLAIFILATPRVTVAKNNAMTPEALWMSPLPDECQKVGVMANLIVRARDEGLDQKDAVKRVRALSSAFPEQGFELAPDIYRHKELDREDIGRYVMFSCHAHAYGLPALELDEVARELRDCGAKFGRDECVVELRNIITGAPRKFRPPSRLAPTPALPGR